MKKTKQEIRKGSRGIETELARDEFGELGPWCACRTVDHPGDDGRYVLDRTFFFFFYSDRMPEMPVIISDGGGKKIYVSAEFEWAESYIYIYMGAAAV